MLTSSNSDFGGAYGMDKGSWRRPDLFKMLELDKNQLGILTCFIYKKDIFTWSV